VARRYPEAASAFARIAAPECSHHAFLASCYAQIGDKEATHRHVAEVLKRSPEFSTESFLLTLHYKRPEEIEHHRAALLKAGLPE
jgi:adenylate cyclase